MIKMQDERLEPQLEKAKHTLDRILSKAWGEREATLEKYMDSIVKDYGEYEKRLREFVSFLPKNSQHIIASTPKTSILDLGGYIAKIKYEQFQDQYVLGSFPGFEGGLSGSYNILQQLGFPVVETYFDFKNGITIQKDERENGRYAVNELSEEVTSRLKNRDELRKESDRYLGILRDIYYHNKLVVERKEPTEDSSKKWLKEFDDYLLDLDKRWSECNDKDKSLPLYEWKNKILKEEKHGISTNYSIKINDHVTSEGPEEAFRHMFFVKIDSSTNEGKLVLGDLDHVIIYKRLTK